MQFGVFWPILIVLLTLNFTTVRDIMALNKRIVTIKLETALSLEQIKKSGKQMEFFESLRADLLKLAPNDPVAAKIISDYFPTRPAQKPGSPDAKTPAK